MPVALHEKRVVICMCVVHIGPNHVTSKSNELRRVSSSCFAFGFRQLPRDRFAVEVNDLLNAVSRAAFNLQIVCPC